jgi:hypothetical protein
VTQPVGWGYGTTVAGGGGGMLVGGGDKPVFQVKWVPPVIYYKMHLKELDSFPVFKNKHVDDWDTLSLDGCI